MQNRKKRLWFRQIFLELPGLFFSAFLLGGMMLLAKPFYLRQTLPDLIPLLAAAMICFLIMYAGAEIIRLRQTGRNPEMLKTVLITPGGITLGEKAYTVTAITDTGNNLYDRKDGMPVHILERDCLLKEGQLERILENEPWRIHFVPYSSLGNSHGMLLVFEAEHLEILENGKTMELEHQKLGLTEHKLCGSGQWKMLLHPDLQACMQEKGGLI